jgi:hypothetical protein
MENNKDKPVSKEEQPSTEEQKQQQQEKQSIPAPIPEKSAWKVEVTEKISSEIIEVAAGKNQCQMI